MSLARAKTCERQLGFRTPYRTVLAGARIYAAGYQGKAPCQTVMLRIAFMKRAEPTCREAHIEQAYKWPPSIASSKAKDFGERRVRIKRSFICKGKLESKCEGHTRHYAWDKFIM